MLLTVLDFVCFNTGPHEWHGATIGEQARRFRDSAFGTSSVMTSLCADLREIALRETFYKITQKSFYLNFHSSVNLCLLSEHVYTTGRCVNMQKDVSCFIKSWDLYVNPSTVSQTSVAYVGFQVFT